MVAKKEFNVCLYKYIAVMTTELWELYFFVKDTSIVVVINLSKCI